MLSNDRFLELKLTMPENLSIENAPDHVVQRLRRRAERHHRSLQGELLAIIEAAVRQDEPAAPSDILTEVRQLGLQTPSEAAALIRADRDGH
jgi:antitoxin FitA